jgi:O-antigen ligase
MPERLKESDHLDQAMEWLLIALLAFAPFAFGVVQAWSEEIVVVLAALVTVCFCVQRVVTRPTTAAWTWAAIPVAAILLLALVQTIPLPVRLVGFISPNTVAQKAQLLADLDGRSSLPPWMQISFYPYATVHHLRLVLAAAAIFVVVLRMFRRPDQITRLLLAVAVIGAAVALVTLAQDILGNGKIYWSAASPHGSAFSGPFVNHSHYAQFMSLSMGAALAVILVKVHEVFQGGRTTPAAVAEYLSSSQGGLVWGLSAMIVLGAATIFLSLSCGGMISLMVAGVFTTLVLSFTKSVRGPGWLMAMMALGALIGVLYCGFDGVYERLGALRGLNRAGGGRWQIVEDVAVAWTRFPVTGTGLGTHEVVYPMFDRSASPALVSHAENEYAQAAEEMGLLGLAALLALAVFVWHSYAKAVRTAGVPICSAAYGLGFGLSAVMVHSLSDFGQHLPANAVLSAVFCALMIRLPHLGRRGGTAALELPAGPKRGRLRGWLTLAAVCLVSGWAIGGADAARRGEAYWGRALARERSLVGARPASSSPRTSIIATGSMCTAGGP